MLARKSLVLTAALGVLLMAGSASAGDHKCSGTVAQEMAKLGIVDSAIEKTVYTANKAGSNCDDGFFAWIDLKDKPGALVVGLKADCVRRDVFTTGGLRLDGVAAY